MRYFYHAIFLITLPYSILFYMITRMKSNENNLSLTPILLHCCCGPCSTSSIERLKEEGYEVHMFYSNSNIYPKEEWERRFGELKKVGEYFHLPITKKEYQHDTWLEKIKGHEDDKEGKERCSICFEYNLHLAAMEAKKRGFSHFTTTLSVSPYKHSLTIFSIGEKSEGFVPINFKKKGGYHRSIDLSNELNLYRQDYCGCEFSLRKESQKK